jgi:glycosyltransferase involved in cell wall biosynthesis
MTRLQAADRAESCASEALCSVVMPAHNEAGILAERLEGLLRSLPPGAVEIVVVANGCSDDTAAIARSLPGVRVVELSEPSKIAALNAGDREVAAFPRIYLDADIRIAGETLLGLAGALRTEAALIAAPHATFDLTGCTWPVRAFFAVFRRLPYAGGGLVGLGVYGISEAGRQRFGEFPDVVADDLYVQRLFGPEERRTVDGIFEIVVPRTTRDLLAVRTRVARGNRQIASQVDDLGLEPVSTTGGTLGAMLRTVGRRPWLLPAAVVYVAVTLVARTRARRVAPDAVWERDESSRATGGALRAPTMRGVPRA